MPTITLKDIQSRCIGIENYPRHSDVG